MSSVEASRFLALPVMVAIVCAVVPADAGRLVCPVCGQIFKDNTKVCPNDGTDLQLLGKPIPDKGPEDEDDGADGETKQPAREDKRAAGRYKRHDRGGARKVISEDASSGYSDRRKRIVEERRLPPEEIERSRRPGVQAAEAVKIEIFEEKEEAPEDVEDAAESFERSDDLSEKGAPLTSLGIKLFWLPEGHDSGATTGAEIDLNLLRKNVRVGLSSFIAVRCVRSREDLVFMEHLNVGYQYLGRFSPYVVFRLGIGAVATERFGVERVRFARAFGFESGVDVWVSPWFDVSPVLGFTRFVVEDTYWHSFTMKIAVGF